MDWRFSSKALRFLKDLSKTVDSMIFETLKLFLTCMKFYKLYVDKIDYYYLRNVFLNSQKNFRLLSQLSEKISNAESHTIWGYGQFMETALSIVSP